MADRPASNLKFAKDLLDPSFFNNDPMVVTQYEKALAAEKRLDDILERRRTGVSPANMALTAALLDPGKTGSFFEALGRGAGAYGAASVEEDKAMMEDAAMRMQLEDMRLGRIQQGQTLKGFQNLKNRPVPGGGVIKEGDIPEGASGPVFNVMGAMVTPDDIAEYLLKMPRLGQAMKEAYELKLNSISVQPGYTVNKITGESKPHAGGKAEPVVIPEIGATVMMSAEDTMAYRAAKVKAAKGGEEGAQAQKEVYAIIKRNTETVGPRPDEVEPTPVDTGSGAVKPPVKPVSIRQPVTVESMKTNAEAISEAAKTLTKDYAEATTKFLSANDYNRESQNAAADVKSMLEGPGGGKLVGLFDKKGFAPAFWNLVSSTMNIEGGDNGARARADLAKADLQKIVMQVDKNFTNEDIAKVNAIAGNLARMELGLRKQTYAGSGMGSVSNMEGIPIQQIIGSRYENAASLRRKMATIGRGFQLDSDIAQAYRDYASKPGNEYKHLEDFKREPGGVYKGLIKEANAWAVENLKIPARQPSALVEPSAASGTPPQNRLTASALKIEAEKRRKAGGTQ